MYAYFIVKLSTTVGGGALTMSDTLAADRSALSDHISRFSVTAFSLKRAVYLALLTLFRVFQMEILDV